MFILGKKLNMTQKFASDGTQIPVTAIEAGPCKVIQVKTAGKEGYSAVQIGFGKKRKLNKASAGHQKGNSFAHLREFRVSADEKFELGQGFKGFPASHGHDKPRRPGSIGSRFPQHTLKGTRMAGRMGGHQVTVSNLVVIDVNPKENLVWVKGAVPGATGGLVKLVSLGSKAEEIKLNEFRKSIAEPKYKETKELKDIETDYLQAAEEQKSGEAGDKK